VRNMEYEFPGEGLDTVKDQFMLGKMIMVAPVLEKGDHRKIIFPKGKWQSEDGKIFKGPSVKIVEVGLGDVPVFKKL